MCTSVCVLLCFDRNLAYSYNMSSQIHCHLTEYFIILIPVRKLQYWVIFKCFLGPPKKIFRLASARHISRPPITYFVIQALLLTDLSTVKRELKLFHKRLSRLSNLPRDAVNALAACDKVIYPNVFRLLQLLATHPVSSASNERYFSTMKRIKTYLRNSVGEARLNGLAILSIHRDIDVQTVIDDLNC